MCASTRSVCHRLSRLFSLVPSICVVIFFSASDLFLRSFDLDVVRSCCIFRRFFCTFCRKFVGRPSQRITAIDWRNGTMPPSTTPQHSASPASRIRYEGNPCVATPSGRQLCCYSLGYFARLAKLRRCCIGECTRDRCSLITSGTHSAQSFALPPSHAIIRLA